MDKGGERYGFWRFVSDNPIMVIVILVILLGLAAIVAGYREGFASVLTGIFGFMKKDDADRRIEEKKAEIEKIEAENRLTEARLPEVWQEHDEEANKDVENAKAYVDELDIDELVSLGNSILSGGLPVVPAGGHGKGGSQA